MPFLRVTKNQYPYITVHTTDCSQGARAAFSSLLSDHEIAYMGVGKDYCKKCMTDAAKSEFWAIEGRVKDEAAKSRRRARTAREFVALTLARIDVQGREEFLHPDTQSLIIEYMVTMSDGRYSRPEVRVDL